ncbi:peptidase inhibitor family I36 protein [Streptomyces mirabilis]|uniref:peptidase inhibitor family I36 protein n=1 Tax=Streptomyces mirabilis TaxID=68239 RepID=UPI0036826FBC
MPYPRTVILAATALAASFALTACGSGEPATSADSDPKKLSGEQRTITEQVIPIPQLQDNPQPQGGFGVNVCGDVNFSDDCEDRAIAYDKAPDNTKISSIRNRTPFSITFYDNENYSGDSITLKPHQEVSSLNPAGAESGINDRISSWQPQVETRAGEKAVLTVCTDNDLAGQCEDVPVVQNSAKSLNDSISSIQNPSDFDVTFYRDNGWGGPGISIPAHTYVRSIDPDGINSGMNDAISSWQPISEGL